MEVRFFSPYTSFFCRQSAGALTPSPVRTSSPHPACLEPRQLRRRWSERATAAIGAARAWHSSRTSPRLPLEPSLRKCGVVAADCHTYVSAAAAAIARRSTPTSASLSSYTSTASPINHGATRHPYVLGGKAEAGVSVSACCGTARGSRAAAAANCAAVQQRRRRRAKTVAAAGQGSGGPDCQGACMGDRLGQLSFSAVSGHPSDRCMHEWTRRAELE
jgi:hypothetical protein